MTKSGFVHLHVHSEYSISNGLLTIEQMIAKAQQDNMQAVALTDLHNTYASVKFYKKAIAAKIKPVIGVELRIVDDICQEEKKSPHKGRMGIQGVVYKLLVYCQNQQGYLNVCELLTQSYQTGQVHGISYVNRSWLNAENTQGLIAVEPGAEGFCAQTKVASQAALEPWLELFPNRYYLGLHRLSKAETGQWEQQLHKLCREKPLPIVALNAVCFADKSDHQAHEVRVCIQEGQVLEARDGDAYSPLQHWRSQANMQKLFADIPEAIENSVVIAKRCNLHLPIGKVCLPDFPLPDGQNLESYLRSESERGLADRWEKDKIAADKQAAYTERLNIELGIIERMGFAGYFLIVADFISWAKKNDIAVGPGRGSGAGSLVAYALRITDIDPLPHGLLFERFLNPERVSMPDFDVDFCMIYRDKVIAYVGDRYGQACVAQIITHGSMAAKASVRDVGRVLAHPYGFVDKLAKLIPNDLGITLEKALIQAPDLQEKYRNEQEVKDLLDMAIALEGTVRNVGRHAGGVVIAPGKLTDFCPLYLEEGSTNQVTQLDMGDVESIGLVKFDFLGLRTLTIIQQTIVSLQKDEKALSLDIATIPLDDPKTFSLLKQCKTVAVFQLESKGFQELIGRLQPDCFADIVALVALYRPGPLQSGMVDDFIDRKHGRAKVVYLHPCMETILRETYGVIVYQEQVMQIAQAMAGYTLGDADLLRRAMGKKKPEEMAKQRTIFLEGSKKQGVDPDLAGQVFDLMEKFAGYGFNKSHSVAYALISFQTAYLKAHYPDYFMAAVLSSDMDNTDKVVHYSEDCKASGLTMLPPCVGNSLPHFHVEKPGVIRYGLGAIKGVGESMAEQVVQAREKHGTSVDLLHFCVDMDEAKLNKKVLEALITGGALDLLGQERGVLMGSIEKVLAQKDQHMRNCQRGQGDLFGGGVSKVPACQYAEALPNWRLQECLAAEKAVLGQYFSGHPLDPYQEEIKQLQCARLDKLRPQGKQAIHVAGIVTKQRRMTTKGGRMFVLITLMDYTGTFEIACFDDKMTQVQLATTEHEVVVCKGVVQEGRKGGELRFNVQEITSLTKVREARQPTLHIEIHEEDWVESLAENLRVCLSQQRKGTSPIKLWYKQKSTRLQLQLKKNATLFVDEAFIQTLQEIAGVSKVQLVYSRGR